MMHENVRLFMMSRFLLFESGVNTRHDDMTCKWLFMIKSMLSHFKHKGSKHYFRDQDPEMYECMMKNLLCSTF